MERKSIITGDGSSSFYVPALDETYHSRHGALTESVHVFIKGALYERLSIGDITTVNILEVGFGTGLNALLSVIASLNKKFSIHYVGLEPFPLDKGDVAEINYPTLLSRKDANEWLQWLHSIGWDQKHTRDLITVEKVKSKLEDFESTEKFDVVYFDAFAPEKQPELWELVVFKKVFQLMNELGVLTTYGAKGQVKRDLISSGFMIENLKGAPGKREMIRAKKPPQNS